MAAGKRLIVRLLSCLSALVCIARQIPPGAVFVSPGRVTSVQRLHSSRATVAKGGPGKDAATESPLEQLEGVVDAQMRNLKVITDSEPSRKLGELLGEERYESIKTGIVAIASCVVPEAIVGWLDPDRLTPRWEFQLDVLALQVLLFALVYRYAVREGDDNPMQRLGIIAAFVIPRAFFMVELPQECLPGPITCGPYWLNAPVLLQIAKQLIIGGATLGGAAYGLERGVATGVIRRFGGAGGTTAPPTEGGFRFPF
mmetsp:Transcript_8307/g.14894  ORF Transcript_8307/g.14894 Transcript_8307/m.14894 type:complete len:256 (-) Transcript_8307:34-801(-)